MGTVLRVVMMLESRINNKKRLKKKEVNLLIWQCGPSFWSGFVLFFRNAEDGRWEMFSGQPHCFESRHILF